MTWGTCKVAHCSSAARVRLECGLVRPSFVPPPPIRRLHNLTRYRAAVTAERTWETRWLEKLLEDTGIKLSAVTSMSALMKFSDLSL